VIGFRRASVPEVVEDGRTGFVVNDVEAMAEAIGRLDSIDRRECRRAAEQRFTYARMVDDVEEMYRSIVGRDPVAVGPGAPSDSMSRPAEDQDEAPAGYQAEAPV
jgi:hypothetical protein